MTDDAASWQDADDDAGMDFPVLVLTLLSDDWLFFADDEIAWDGRHHHAASVQVNAAKAAGLMGFVNAHVDGFEDIGEVVRYFLAFLREVEKDEGLRVPRALVHPGLRAALREGDLTGITLANLAACGGAFRVRTSGTDGYAVLYDARLARGIPRFFDLVARLLWDLRHCTASEKGAPFSVTFASARDFDADSYLGSVEEPVPGAQRDPGVLRVAEAPAIALPAARGTGGRLEHDGPPRPAHENPASERTDENMQDEQTPEDQEVVIPHLEADALDAKAVGAFAGKIVRKDLTAMMKRGANVPTFVLEYLLGMYCSTDDEEAAREGVARIRKILNNNYVRPDESETIKSKIRELGQYTIIDKVHARLDEYRDVYVAGFTNLAIEEFVMPAEYVRTYTKILQGGIWCIMRIEYRRAGEDDDDALADVFDDAPRPRPKKKSAKRGPEDSPFHVTSLRPIQMPNLDLDSIIGARREFTTREWEDLLLRSCGYEPDALEPKQKLHFIERMVPLVERNYNLCELGPRGTGKSHVYKEISPYSILLSGGQTTTANLFGRMNAGRNAGPLERAGLVGNWDCVTFDEVAGMRFRDTNAIQVLKDFMASGSFARGREQLNADASLVFEGNINDTVENVLKTTHLFDPFPPEFNNDSAFFDRIHCYLPGWEVPKMRSGLLTAHYGLITDCLSEFCHEMRKRDYTHLIDGRFRLNGDFNKRDEIGVRKTFSGLAKLLFPDEQMTREEAAALLDYAIEGRRRVKEQLKIMAGVEFIDVNLGYVDLDTMEAHVVPVPEQSEGTLVPEGPLQAGHVFGIGKSEAGDWAIYKLENRAVAGNFDFKTEGLGSDRRVKDTMEAAFQVFRDKGAQVAPGMRIAEKDYLLYFDDSQKKGLSEEVSLAEFVGLCSAACNRPVEAGTVIPGVLRISGTIDEVVGLEDIMRVAKNAGARRVLLPLGCIGDLAHVSKELIGSVSTDFYPDEDVVACACKALGL